MWARINSGKRNTVAHTVNILRTHGQECWHAGAPRIDRRVQIRRLLCKLPATRLLLFGLPAARALPRGGARCLRRRLPGQQRLLQVGCRGDVVRAGAAHGGHAGGQHSQQRVLPQALQGARGGGGGGVILCGTRAGKNSAYRCSHAAPGFITDDSGQGGSSGRHHMQAPGHPALSSVTSASASIAGPPLPARRGVDGCRW